MKELMNTLVPAMLLVCGLTTVGSAQPAPIEQYEEPFDFFSGMFSGVGETEPFSVIDQLVVDGVPWMRLYFGETNLGANSYLVVNSDLEGTVQTIDAAALKSWSYATAAFNGDSLTIELVVAPGDADIFYSVETAVVGDWGQGDSKSQQIKSICGTTDNRVASNDNRGGRLRTVGCTAWLIQNDAVLTAGHCVDLDPDRSGPLLPDGVLDMTANWWVEFNVPASLANGTIVNSAPADQYPIANVNSTQWRFDGEGQGLGKDWAVFALGDNGTTGTDPHIRFGFWRVSDANPAGSNTMRITGFGSDNLPPGSTGNRNAQNQTNQTHTGPYVEQVVSGADIWHRYQVDTTGGNSGSPIIWQTPSPDITVGIHTNAGCGGTDGSISGANSGTSFEVNALETAIATFPPGTGEEYVDTFNYPADGGITENGTIFHPWNSIAEGVAAAPDNGVLSVVEGTYVLTGQVIIGADGRGLTLHAPVGTVTIR